MKAGGASHKTTNGREVRDKLPERLAPRLGVEIPDGISDGSGSDGNDSLRTTKRKTERQRASFL
jgi:hypothetical protein